MSHQNITNSYSVFVGHLHPDVTRRELLDVFKVCGDILEVVILESPTHSYNYGFVRFMEVEAAYRAIRELNRWPMKGIELVVDISRDTANRIKREKAESAAQQVNSNGTSGARREPQNNRPSNASLFVQDTMYLNRLKENCAAIHRKASDGTGIVGADYFLDDIGEATASRFPSLWGTIGEPAISFNNISLKIMQRCKNSTEVDPPFGEKKAAEFLSSLEIIMKEIGDVIGLKLEQKSRTEKAGGQSDNITDDDLAIKQCLDDIRQETGEDSGHCVDKSDKMSESISKDVRCVAKHRVYKGGDNFDWCSDDEDQNELSDKRSDKVSEFPVEQNLDTGASDGHNSSNTCDKSKLDNLLKSMDIDSNEKGRLHVNTGAGCKAPEDLESTESKSKPYQAEYLDPAILDFHLSQLADQEQIDIKQKEQNSILDEFFKNISIQRQTSDAQMARSLSQDSSMSSGSNEGTVDDSGVETDFNMIRNNQQLVPEVPIGYGSDRVKGRRSYQDMAIAATKRATARMDNVMSVDDFVKKSLARGRGIKIFADQQNKLPLGRSAFHK